jgi:hypothetical protein
MNWLFNNNDPEIQNNENPLLETFQEIEIKKQRSIDNEYNLIKGNFLNEIKKKIIYFKQVLKICSEKCIQEKCNDDKTMCSQINSMMQERPNSEFVTLCRNTAASDSIKQICSIANTIEDTIEKLFIAYKKDYKDKPHNEDYDKIILAEKRFYDLTKSKLRSGEYKLLLEDVKNGLKNLPEEINIGGRRRRLTRGKKHFKKSKNKKSKKRTRS